MHYEPTQQDLDALDFERFRSVSSCDEFFGKPGKQHYRLLSYFSTLFHNRVIFDIGTHRGNSALALSFNPTNTIHSFDIVNHVVNQNIRETPNIIFHCDQDLFSPQGQTQWKETILESAFIFLDVDPHNGHMELSFYEYLQSINYQGFVICDDIWYFKEMRDNFWYKIPHTTRYDMTGLGHASGTGIFTFNPDITFPRGDNSDWTLVTGYFNLTKCPDASAEIRARDASYYLNSARSTLSLPYHLVIFCDEESRPQIERARPADLRDRTEIVTCTFDDFVLEDGKTFREYRETIIENRVRHPYHFDNRNTASYYLFCLSRYLMLKKTIQKNPFGSTHFAWINFCIERMGYTNLVQLDEALATHRDKFSTCYIDYIPRPLVENTAEYFQFGRCGMCSGFFTGKAEYMHKVCDLIEKKFIQYARMGYGHADEQLFSPVYFENPDLFEHYYGDYHQMITNYKYIHENPEAPIYNFITRSFQHANYEKCYEACEFVWRSVCLGKCDLSEEYLTKLYYYYMSCRRKLDSATACVVVKKKECLPPRPFVAK